MKYYYKANNDIITYLGRNKKVPKNCTEISEEDYFRYIAIMNNIPAKEGYDYILTLYTDFTFSVEYIPVEVEGEE